MFSKFPDRNNRRFLYLGNMSDLLRLVHDTKQGLIAKYGVEEGTERFGKLRAKDVLDKNAILSDGDVH